MLDFVKNIFAGKDLKSTSPAGKLDVVDFKKLLRNLLVVAAGAVLTYLSQWVSGTDFGSWNGIIVPLVAGLIDAARKWLTNQTPTENTPEVK